MIVPKPKHMFIEVIKRLPLATSSPAIQRQHRLREIFNRAVHVPLNIKYKLTPNDPNIAAIVGKNTSQAPAENRRSVINSFIKSISTAKFNTNSLINERTSAEPPCAANIGPKDATGLLIWDIVIDKCEK